MSTLDEAKRRVQAALPKISEETKETASTAAHVANDAVNSAADAVGLTPLVHRNPYAMVAAAMGVGYVLGGGLFTPTTARLLRMGARLASVPLVRDRLLEIAEAAVDSIVGPEGRQATGEQQAPAPMPGQKPPSTVS